MESETTIDNVAPVLLLSGVLAPELCTRLIAYYREQCGGGQPSGVLHYEGGEARFAIDPTVKMRREAVITDTALEREIHAQIEANALQMIFRAFQYPVQQREAFRIISYDGGQGYFRAHRDNETPDVAHRRFAMTMNLNTGDYAGGALRFPEFGDRLYVAPAGGALVFSCSLLHEVTPITAGQRVAMTTFLSGPR